MKRTLSWALPLLFAAGAAAAAGSAGADSVALLDKADAKWRQGPAKYLLEKEEDAQFRKLKTDEERKQFIEQFWARRDPSPGTPENEFKEVYARRLKIAEEKFAAPHGQGWEDERSKAVMLLGAPDSMEVKEMGGAGGGGGVGSEPAGPGGSAGGGETGSGPARRITFVYTHPVLPDAPTPLRLEFMQEGSGGAHLQTRYDFTDDRLTGVKPLPLPPPPPPQPPAPPATPAQPAAPPEPPPPPAAPDTPQHSLMEEIVSGPTPTSKIPLAARLDYYKTSETGTLATLTLAVKQPAAPAEAPPIVAARVLKTDQEPVLRLEGEDSFAPEGDPKSVKPGADIIYQAAHDLPPGKYSLVAAVKDPASGNVGFVMQSSIEVPDFHSETMGLSSVTLAKKIERLTTPPAGDPRFVRGNFKVIPAPTAQFRAGEELSLYFQIYNTANDPASGQPKIKVSYRFEKIEKAGNRLLGGKPIEQSANSNVQIFAVTVQPQWPAGDYQVVVNVEDLTAKATASATVPFKVVK